MDSIFSAYHPHQYRYRRVDLCPWIKSADTVFSFIQEVKDFNHLLPEGVILGDSRVTNITEAEWIVSTMNTPQTRYNSLRSIQSDRRPWQEFEYIPSNLGVGFLFYFICGGCGRRTSRLYMPDGVFHYSCRQCHKLCYPTMAQKAGDLLRSKKLREKVRYLDS